MSEGKGRIQKRPMCIVVFCGVLAMWVLFAWAAFGEQAVISIHFNHGDDDRVTGVAGALPVPNWCNIHPTEEGVEADLVDVTGNPTSARVRVTSDGTYCVRGPYTPDYALMCGVCDQRDNNHVTKVIVSNLPDSIAGSDAGYTVLVYFNVAPQYEPCCSAAS